MTKADTADHAVIHCSECGGRFTIRAAVRSLVEKDQKILCLCGACSAAFSVEASALRGESTPPSEAAMEQPAAAVSHDGRVVVGLEIPSAQRAVADVLRHHGYAPVCVSTGELVVAACDPVMPERPAAVVLDVAIPGVLAFEAIAAIRAFDGGAQIPIVLLASVYEKTRYKRQPNRLYGADAYLELHHVPDQLASLIDALIHHQEPSKSRAQSPTDRARTAPLRAGFDDENHDDGRARAVARRLLSDVALYHGDEIAAGVASNQPLQNVQSAIAVAREHFVDKTKSPTKIFDEMVDAFVDQLLHRNVAHEEHGARAAPQ